MSENANPDEAFSNDLCDALPDVFYAFDRDGRLHRWNSELRGRTGYSDGEIAGMDPVEFVPESDRETMRAAIGRVLERGETQIVESFLLTKDGERIPYEFNGSPVTDDGGTIVGVVGTGRDTSGRKERERELQRYETLFETIDDGVYILDAEFRFASVNEAFAELSGYDREELIGAPVSLITNEEGMERGERVATEMIDGERDVGVFRADHVTAEGDQIPVETRFSLLPGDDDDVSSVVGVTRDVSGHLERERALRDQRDELETFNRINVVIRELVRGLVSAASREDIEDVVCARLADSDLYRFAWVGDRDRDADHFVVRAEAGDADGTQEAVESAAETEWNRPATEALRTGKVRAINDIAESDTMPGSVWRATADEAVQSGIAVPISFGGTTYGVLVVYATRPDAFGERERAGFEALGDFVGFAINAVESRRLLFADAVVELTFRIADDDVPCVELTRELTCESRLEDVVPGEDETILSFHRVTGAPPETVRERLENHPDIERVRIITADDDESLLEVRLTGSSPVIGLFGHGASVTKAVTADGETRIVAELPPDADVRSVVEAVTGEFAEAELLRKREVERDVGTAAEVRQTLRDQLTDRQLAALRAAYRAGYFDWPRDSTAEEVADALGVSSATLHQHLRKAQKKLLDAFFDPE